MDSGVKKAIQAWYQMTADYLKDGFGWDYVDLLFPGYFQADQLYNLEADPCEQNNLANDPAYGTILAELKEKLRVELEKLPHPFGEFKTTSG